MAWPIFWREYLNQNWNHIEIVLIWPCQILLWFVQKPIFLEWNKVLLCIINCAIIITNLICNAREAMLHKSVFHSCNVPAGSDFLPVCFFTVIPFWYLYVLWNEHYDVLKQIQYAIFLTICSLNGSFYLVESHVVIFQFADFLNVQYLFEIHLE